MITYAVEAQSKEGKIDLMLYVNAMNSEQVKAVVGSELLVNEVRVADDNELAKIRTDSLATITIH